MKKIYNITNLDCANCAIKIENEIRKIDSIISFNINFILQKMTIETSVDLNKILPQIKKIAEKVEPDCKIYE